MLIVSNYNAEYGITVWDEGLNLVDKLAPGQSFLGMYKRQIKDYVEIWCVDGHDRSVWILNDEMGMIKTKLEVPRKDAHGICIWDDTLAVADTQGDRILFFDINTYDIKYEWSLSRIVKDRHHVNDIKRVGDRLYVSAFLSHFLPDGRRWREMNGAGFIMDISGWYFGHGFVEVVKKGMDFPHTIGERNGLVTCAESYHGRIWQGDEILFETPAFVRGFCFEGDRIYAASSAVGTHGLAGLSDKSHLYVIENKTAVKKVDIPSDCGECYDVIKI